MSRIRGRNTSPERLLRKLLWKEGLRYRLQLRTLGCRPDLVIPAARVVVFIDGCFWHGCPEHYVRPRSRNAFWDSKLTENVARDRRQTLALDAAGWRVIRIWEHELLEAPERVAKRVLSGMKRGTRTTPLSMRVVRVEVLDAAQNLERRFLEELRSSKIASVDERRRSTRKTGRVR
jgi:DNA mismatch endonuclease (patch repair protein)